MIDLPNISLIGFMGVGKTTIARHLGNYLNMNVIEVDKFIETKVQIPLQDYVQNHLKEFRMEEANFCKEMSLYSNTIFDFGGGIISNEKNIKYLRLHSFVVLLIAPLSVISSRIKNDGIIKRPLLHKKDLDNSILRLWNSRKKSYYKTAHFKINTHKYSYQEISKIIEDKMQKWI